MLKNTEKKKIIKEKVREKKLLENKSKKKQIVRKDNLVKKFLTNTREFNLCQEWIRLRVWIARLNSTRFITIYFYN